MTRQDPDRKPWRDDPLVLDEGLIEQVVLQFVTFRRSIREIQQKTRINPYLSQEALRRYINRQRQGPTPRGGLAIMRRAA